MNRLLNKYHSVVKKLSQLSWPMRLTILLLILTALLPTLTWFKPGMIIFRGDPPAALAPVRYFLERFSVWDNKNNLGAEQSVATASIVHQFIQAIPAFFGASDRTTEIWHFTFWLIAPGITLTLLMSLLTRRLSISQWAIPVAVVYYLFNLYRVAIFGDNNHFAIYTCLPLLLYWVTLASEPDRGWLKPAAGFALSTLLASESGTNPPMYGMLIGVGIYGFFLFISQRPHWRRISLFWLVALTFSFLLNLYWLAPLATLTLSQHVLTDAHRLNWLNDLSRHTSLDRVVRLIGAWAWFDGWRGEAYAPYAAQYMQPFWRGLAIIPALLSLSVLFFRRARNITVASFLVIGLLGIIYAQGTHPPFGSFFVWSAHHIPFFWLIRSPWYKFSNLIALSYAVLIGLGLGYCLSWLEQVKMTVRLRQILPAVIVALVMLLPLIIAHPLITGRLWLSSHDVVHLAPDIIPYPVDAQNAANWLNAQPGDTAVALLPYQGAAVYKWGFASPLDPLYYLSGRPLFYRGDRIGSTPGETPGASTAYRVFVEKLYSNDPSALQVARLLGIEYIVARNDIDYTFYDDHDSPQFVKEKVSRLPETHLVRSFGQLDVYKIDKVVDNHAFATNQTSFFDGHPLDSLASILTDVKKDTNAPWPAVMYTRPIAQPSRQQVQVVLDTVKPTDQLPTLQIAKHHASYTVKGVADKPFVLVLNQSYDPHWQAKSKTAVLSPTFPINGYAPAWLVTPKGEFTVTIEFGPQRYVLPGLVLTVILGLGLLAVLNLKRIAFLEEIG